MKWKNTLAFLLTLLIIASCSNNKNSSEQSSKTKAQTDRKIKTLSPKELEGYLKGKGMGMAKVAELNGYPGPRHVLEIKEKLEITKRQKSHLRDVYKKMQERAKKVGKHYVKLEEFLNKIFASNQIDRNKIRDILMKRAEIKSELIFTHINAHLETKKILNEDQIKKYYQLKK